MAFLADYTLVLQYHPLKGIIIKVRKDTKTVSAYTPNIPNSLRIILRKALLQHDCSSLLEELLDEEDVPQIVVKVGTKEVPCNWDKTLFYEQKETYVLRNQTVTQSFVGNMEEILLLSDVFCLFYKTQMLGRVKPIESPTNKKQAKVATYSFLEFNQLGLCLEKDRFKDEINCYEEDNRVIPEVCKGNSTLWVHYAKDLECVQLLGGYQHDSSRYTFSSTYAAAFYQLVFVFEWPLAYRQALAKWICRYHRSSELFQKRLVTHFLPKLCFNPDKIESIKQHVAVPTKEKTVLNVVNNQWKLSEMKPVLENQVWFLLGLLFPQNISFNQEEVSLTLAKNIFHQQLELFLACMHSLGINVDFSQEKVDIVHEDLTIDVSLLDDTNMMPDIRLSGRSLEVDDIFKLKENLWSTVTDHKVTVVNENLIKQLETVLTIVKNQEQTKALRLQDNTKRTFHLLDWISLKKSGVNIILSPEQERLIQSFLSFESIRQYELPKKLEFKPRQYQVEGINWMMFLYDHKLGGVLADDMGLGKTYQSILFLALVNSFQNKTKKPHLIVVPPTLMFNWKCEFEKFYPDLEVYVYSGKDRKIDQSYDVMITSYDLLRRDSAELAKVSFHVVIFDEAQYVKNKASARSQATKAINRQFTLCLTGTPVENHISEYINILHTALPGLVSDSIGQRDSVSVSDLQYVVQRSKPFVLRRLKQQIIKELPPKTEEVIYFDMEPKQKEMYDSLVQLIKNDIKKDKAKFNSNKIQILTYLLRLRQICISPSLVHLDYPELAPKFSFLRDKLETLQEEGHSALVFSQFTKSLDIIEKCCKENNIRYFRLDGSVSVAKRKKDIEAFQNSKEPHMFLISLKAGGVGLNLTKASYVFHIDPWWNPAVENQATDRAHRIGQEQHVFSYKLIMHHSIEENIQKIKANKSRLFKSLLDDSQVVNRSATLTSEDIHFLLNHT